MERAAQRRGPAGKKRTRSAGGDLRVGGGVVVEVGLRRGGDAVAGHLAALLEAQHLAGEALAGAVVVAPGRVQSPEDSPGALPRQLFQGLVVGHAAFSSCENTPAGA